MSAIRNLTHKSYISDTDRPANILCLPFDGYFEYWLAKITGHNIYCCIKQSYLRWPPTPRIDNVKWLNALPGYKGYHYIFDFILCNDRFNQYEIAKKLSHSLLLPILLVDHIVPTDKISTVENYALKSTRHINYSVAVTPEAFNHWGNDELILPYIDIPSHIDDDRTIDLLVGGYFQPNEYNIVRQLTNNITNSHIIGPNKDLSSECMTWDEFNQLFLKSKIFVNLSTSHSLTPYLLQAIASGCTIISNDIPVVKNLLGDNAYYISNIDETLNLIKRILTNPFTSNNQNVDMAKKYFNNFHNWNTVIKKLQYETLIL
jgi:glycosyltransferase involved in cell wall biosynthesis